MKGIAVIRSMTSKAKEAIPRATFLMHTGYIPTASKSSIRASARRWWPTGDWRPEERQAAVVRAASSGRVPNNPGGGFLGVQYDPFDIQNPVGPADEHRAAHHQR